MGSTLTHTLRVDALQTVVDGLEQRGILQRRRDPLFVCQLLVDCGGSQCNDGISEQPIPASRDACVPGVISTSTWAQC